MDKADLEKLRKGEIYALAALLPAEKAWGMELFPADLHDIISPLLDHIDALERSTKEAVAERDKADDLLRRVLTPPPGWVVVPYEPTKEMLEAVAFSTPFNEKDAAEIFSLMTAAAPEPQS